MNVSEVVHSASFGHGLSGDLDGPCPFEPQTARSVRYLLDRGLIERRERVVDLGPRRGLGNWPAMEPHGVTRIVTWHLTPAGRDAWVKGRL